MNFAEWQVAVKNKTLFPQCRFSDSVLVAFKGGNTCAEFAYTKDRPHGWLCRNHSDTEDQLWRNNQPKNRPRRDLDAEIVESIIRQDQRDIAKAMIHTLRLGCIEPIYFKTEGHNQDAPETTAISAQ